MKMQTTNSWAKTAAEILIQHNNFLIISHEGPDGDTLGSSLALFEALSQMGKKVQITCADPVPTKYQCIPNSDQVQLAKDVTIEHHFAIAVDAATPQMLGQAKSLFQSAEHTMLIDHHDNNPPYADNNFVYSNIAAVGEMMYLILLHLPITITKVMAQCMLIAISTDTGHFVHNNTNAQTLYIASKLLAAGADISKMYAPIYTDRTESATRLIGKAITSLQMHCKGQVACMSLTAEDFSSIASKEPETEGIIDYARQIIGVHIAVLFRQSGEQETKVSLRSDHSYDVSQIARSLGGGGHKGAAGIKLPLPFAQAQEKVMEQIYQTVGCK